MKSSIATKISIIALSGSIIFAQSAFAARMGSGKSSGMQRNINSQQYSNTQSASNYGNNQNYNNGSQQQKRGPGIGSVVAGAAAGAVGGYMLGKAMNSNSNESQVTHATSSSSNIPWGIIIILGMLLFIGLMIFRRKTTPQTNQGNPFTNTASATSGNNNFEIPTIRRDSSSNGYASQQQPTMTTQPAANISERMADGVETQYFLRQAKGMFLHIQSMNTPDNVSEVEKYMTPELYVELKQLISANDYVADFNQLDCQLMQSTVEGNNYIASVRFFGKVSEAPNSPAVDFNEIWHFVKPSLVESAKWKVSGIQQVNIN